MVDKWPRAVDGAPAPIDTRRQDSTNWDSTRSRRLEAAGFSPPAGAASRASARSLEGLEATTAHKLENLEPLETLNATTETELLEGRGICGRCGGSGSVSSELTGDPRRRRSCPRCDGTGHKLRARDR